MIVRLVAVCLCLLALTGLSRADDALEVITLQHRTVEEVIPSLRPLLEPGGALTGMQGNLILRASSANRAQIKQALAALDVAARQLRVTVRQSLETQRDRQSFELYGKVDGDKVDIRLPPSGTGGARVEVGSESVHIGARLDDRSLDQISRVSQQVRVADGGRALIHAGVDLPLTLRETIVGPYGRSVRESVVFYSVGSGFYVVPHVIGERVTLAIHPVQQAIAASPQLVVGQELHTTVSGRLGEWITLGGGDTLDTQDQQRLLGTSRSESREARQVWLRVDVVD